MLGIFIETPGDSSQTQSAGNMLLSFSERSCTISIYFFLKLFILLMTVFMSVRLMISR